MVSLVTHPQYNPCGWWRTVLLVLLVLGRCARFFALYARAYVRCDEYAITSNASCQYVKSTRFQVKILYTILVMKNQSAYTP